MSVIDELVTMGVIRRDVPLGPLTTYKAGGPAAMFADIGTIDQLRALIETGITREHPILVLGRGSNLVVADAGFDGLVIKLDGAFMSAKVTESRVDAGAAMPLPRLARQAVEAGVLGLEFFVGVPGSVGGAVRQNAGCFGTETRDRLFVATVVDLETGASEERDPRVWSWGTAIPTSAPMRWSSPPLSMAIPVIRRRARRR